MAGGGDGEPVRTFEYTPTWVVSVVCFVIISISLCAERMLYRLGKFFKKKDQKSLFESLQKVKQELMLLGFISLLLTVFQGAISRICIPDDLANIMLPCKLENAENKAPTHQRRLLAEEANQCSQGHTPFLSLEAVHQLHIFIFVLAVVYVVFCASTMVLGTFKIQQWRHWEQSIRDEVVGHHRPHLPRLNLQEFMSRTGNYWRKFTIVSWMASFFKQFYGSVSKSDYIALRSGFIREHCSGHPNYNFNSYMLRTLENDFKKIIGISWYLWLFMMIFLLINIAGWHTYFWMSFIPLLLLLIVGAKLEHIITELAHDAAQSSGVVRLSDDLFWFHRPALVLYLIHFIMFQNSFEFAFFFWIWTTYSFNSCIMDGLYFIIPRLVIGIIVQVLCSYSTMPLYALVSQMGSMFKETIFNELQQDLILSWAKSRKPSSNEPVNALTTEPPASISFAHQPWDS